ncbi:28S ribosomal protein S33, mitochondrial [Diaphorina citri]|uniref:Small ribosomal subunit protein mS33 n=1 Tax=Diaphorina citri TaxID=121845 RepID=A0A1S3D9A1_DIACI|nr:28S ribosomal protein S33, mitochondrial [Diaphorina citri]KAI5698959.1 hypothetical protein M8J75_014407 [Diaphorina citri]KAI5723667.1 hypothetical protein M8J76_009395 [Diaphorina citri]KAI5728175.1 hypothetical protein M8J77_012497 [Diaphorina citri]
MSGFQKYSELIQLTTNYAKRMAILSNRIFGEVPVPRDVKTMNRVVKRFSVLPGYKDPAIIRYYPRHIETGLLMRSLRDYGLYRDEHADFTEEMRRLRALRGKIKKMNKGGEKKSKSLI